MNLKFRKKPVVIEASQMTEDRRASNADWPDWMRLAWQLDREAPGTLSIGTPDEGMAKRQRKRT